MGYLRNLKEIDWSQVGGWLGSEGKDYFKDKGQDQVGLGLIQFVVQFVQGLLLDGLYWIKWYNNQSLGYGFYFFIYYENLLLGVSRLRQLRVRNDFCTVYEDFCDDIMNCYDVYFLEKEEQFFFGFFNGIA